MSGPLAGRIALVTGAGRGIGRAHALLLAERGAAVVVNDLDGEVAQAVVDEIVATGGSARADDRDVSSFADGTGVVAGAVDAFGRLDIVVNNAGLARSAPIEHVSAEQLDRVFGVNFVGPVAVVQAAWPHLVASGHGRIVNTVSEAAFDARMGGAEVGYAAAKAAVWSLTITLADAGREHGITVNAVSPAAFTRMNEEMFREQGRPEGLDLDPVHVARAVAWLVSDEAADVTGRVLHVAGGHHREYAIRRQGDTELVRRIEAALAAPRPTARS